jgi:hypothetical protein
MWLGRFSLFTQLTSEKRLLNAPAFHYRLSRCRSPGATPVALPYAMLRGLSSTSQRAQRRSPTGCGRGALGGGAKRAFEFPIRSNHVYCDLSFILQHP